MPSPLINTTPSSHEMASDPGLCVAPSAARVWPQFGGTEEPLGPAAERGHAQTFGQGQLAKRPQAGANLF